MNWWVVALLAPAVAVGFLALGMWVTRHDPRRPR